MHGQKVSKMHKVLYTIYLGHVGLPRSTQVYDIQIKQTIRHTYGKMCLDCLFKL